MRGTAGPHRSDANVLAGVVGPGAGGADPGAKLAPPALAAFGAGRRGAGAGYRLVWPATGARLAQPGLKSDTLPPDQPAGPIGPHGLQPRHALRYRRGL